jgi:hypothetical protein
MGRLGKLAGTLTLVVGCAWGLAFALAAGCSSSPSTRLVVAVSTQARVPKDLRAVRVVVESAGKLASCTTVAIDADGPGARRLPQTVVVEGAAGQDANVTVAGFASAPDGACTDLSKAVVLRRAKTRLAADESLLLPMALRHACFDVSCGEGETCAAGECVPTDVDPNKLVDYADALVFGDTSFCLPRLKCFENRIPALLLDEASCTFQLTLDVTTDKGINIELVHDDLSREVLDLDPVEGFSIDAQKPDRFTLAPGLCKRFRARKIAAVSIGVGCPGKTSLNPLCNDEIPAPDAGRPPAEAPELCTLAAELPPSRAALYLLADRSRSMRDHLGRAPRADGLAPFAEIVELALRSPVLRTSVVGFRFLPLTTTSGTASECTAAPGAYASLAGADAVPFGPADDARKAIGALLGDATKLDSGDRLLLLDGVLRKDNAYRGLESAGDAATFPRRQVVVLGNRDLASGCTPAIGGPNDHAFEAFTDEGLTTGAVLLSAPPEADQRGRDPFIDAVTTARAGAGPFWDTTFDPKLRAVAMTSVVTDLGSCLYDVPKDLDARALARPTTKLSYFDLLTSNRVDIPFDATCNDRSTGDGFSLDGGRIRVCGHSCNDLRLVMKTAAVYAVEHHVVPPDVPVKLAPSCR